MRDWTWPSVRVLVVNAGSSSLKLRLLDRSTRCRPTSSSRRRGRRAGRGSAALGAVPALDAVGHRDRPRRRRASRRRSARRRACVARIARADATLAPLHNARRSAAMRRGRGPRCRTCRTSRCFDTAFHATLPAGGGHVRAAAAWRERMGVRRYGFHGLSPCSAAAAQVRGAAARGLPPRRRRLGDGGARRPLRRHDDGLHAARGACRWRRAPAPSTRARCCTCCASTGSPPPRLDHVLEHESGLLGARRDAATCATCSRPSDGEPAAALALDVVRASGRRRRWARWPPRWAASTRVAFSGGVGERSRRCARA